MNDPKPEDKLYLLPSGEKVRIENAGMPIGSNAVLEYIAINLRRLNLEPTLVGKASIVFSRGHTTNR